VGPQPGTLLVPGFYAQRALPEVEAINFAPRVKIPVLMLNGRFDFFYPEVGTQIPMYRLLGTPDARKRRVVYDTGHNIPRPDLIRESLDWLDAHLGPVRPLESVRPPDSCYQVEPGLARAKDLSHSALADLRVDFVHAEASAGGEGQGGWKYSGSSLCGIQEASGASAGAS
jgi:hypothetical protein